MSDVEIIEVNERVGKIETMFQEFSDLQLEIETICDEDKLPEQYIEKENFELSYFSALSKAKAMLKQFTKIENHANVVESVNNVKLPYIKLPTFTGIYDEWLEFRDIFISIIHNNHQISKAQKLHYLKSSVRGQAGDILRSFKITDINYDVAWKLLNDRYDNNQTLLNNHVHALFNLPEVKMECSNEIYKFTDEFSKQLLSLEALGEPVQHWKTLLFYLITTKLDSQTRREWETAKLKLQSPTITDLTEFLHDRCRMLESIENKLKVSRTIKKTTSLTVINQKVDPNCAFCKGNHLIYYCEEFLKLTPKERSVNVKNKKLCMNCLKTNHFSIQCKRGGCRKCNKKHNTLLHYCTNEQTDQVKVGQDINSSQLENTVVSNLVNIKNEHVILSTAIVKLRDSLGNYITCRALLDCGSESSFITSELCDRLSLDKNKIDITVIGINQKISQINYKTIVQLHSQEGAYVTEVHCFVIDKITQKLPLNTYSSSLFKVPSYIKLADADFYKSNKIEMLLGANVFWNLIKQKQIKLGNNQPILQSTELGWIIAGAFGYQQREGDNIHCNFAINSLSIDDQLRAFWELEDYSGETFTSQDDKFCEDNYSKTTYKNSEGRFVVSIPFKCQNPKFGNSLETATKRFNSLERKLENNNKLRDEYRNFMEEYQSLGHMTKLINPEIGLTNCYYLPHHGVYKDSSLTTKLRVVFDGSCKTTNNVSLNDSQFIGPIIQHDLFNILLRFRTHKYILSADIEKMYRQVLINPEQRNNQRILWRNESTMPLDHFTLDTVTYGTASAPYLAIRSLQQAAHDYKDVYPNASRVIIEDFYVDDLLTGTDSIENAIQLYNQITEILNSGCFILRKWLSNDTQILQKIISKSENDRVLILGQNEIKKTLGLIWVPTSDFLTYDIGNLNPHTTNTKREILSLISKIYDPLGLVGPCIIIAKIILQELWTYKLSWDDYIPESLNRKWIQFRDQLVNLNQVKIQRNVSCSNCVRTELHAFSDASERAYGACIYVRTISSDNIITTNLLCAKSRVAPIKKITIPRLELCGAVLAARLMSKVNNSLNIQIDKIKFWCDSTIVLCWLRMPSNNLKVFVNHRVAEIQQSTDVNNWNYVNTVDNPADLISKGILPNNLINSSWWKGPCWLSLPESHWPPSFSVKQNHALPEVKENNLTINLLQHAQNEFPFHYFSSFHKLQRIIALCLRFIKNCKFKKDQRQVETLTVVDLNEATKQLVKLAQAESFSGEIQILKAKNTVNLKGNFRQLMPFLDDEGLIRVGGRLKHSSFNIDKKHPFLLCGKHVLSRLIFENEHKRLLHAGPQSLLASVRNKFWVTAGRNLAKSVVHNCVKCYKTKPTDTTQLMGNLPRERLLAMYPFYVTGVDYAGPFLIKDKRGRGARVSKCYICLFICFATKAIHLELVTSLTTEAFIATLRRFVARRGKPAQIFSDNGTNFVGANSQLKKLGNYLLKNKKLNSSISNEMISWKFIPGHSPHFGGLWEAGIKSTKSHLKRVLGNEKITLEEFFTILTQIEGVLNSRPLSPLSSSPDDYEPLTPSHFLLGRPATSVLDADVLEIPVNRLSRYQYLQRIVQHFWKRWSQEFVSELQQRNKWVNRQPNVKIGDLVLLKENNLPPLQWKLGRIITLHPGSDNLVRVVSVKTSSGVIKRAIAKVCVLPIEQ